MNVKVICSSYWTYIIMIDLDICVVALGNLVKVAWDHFEL